MKPQRLLTNLMFVADVTQSAQFYEQLFQTKPIEQDESFCSFRFGDTFFILHPADEKSPPAKGGSVGYWLVDDLDAFLTHAQSLGAEIYRGPLFVQETGRTICQLEDPFGNVFGVEG